MYGEPIRVEGSHKLARAIQHETDHLDGVLFIDRLDAQAREAALDVLRDAAWQGEQAYLPSGEPVPTPLVKVSPH
jgi:peptide deformylase